MDAQRQSVGRTIERCLRVAFTRRERAFAKCASGLMATIPTAMIQRDSWSVRDHRPSVCAVAHTMQRYGWMRSSCVPSGVTPKGGSDAGGSGGFSAWRMIMIVEAKGLGAFIGDSVSMIARDYTALTMFDHERQYSGPKVLICPGAALNQPRAGSRYVARTTASREGRTAPRPPRHAT